MVFYDIILYDVILYYIILYRVSSARRLHAGPWPGRKTGMCRYICVSIGIGVVIGIGIGIPPISNEEKLKTLCIAPSGHGKLVGQAHSLRRCPTVGRYARLVSKSLSSRATHYIRCRPSPSPTDGNQDSLHSQLLTL